jgi:hypothetical protein
MKTKMAAVLALAWCGAACGKGGEEGVLESAPAAEPAQAEVAAPAVKQARRLPTPAGWRVSARGPWSWSSSADGRAHLVEGAVESGSNVGHAVREAAALVGARDLHLADEISISLGEGHLPAQAADGWARTDAGEARVAYAVVEPGDGDGLLVLHVFARDTAGDTQRAALAAIASVR